MRLRTWPGNEDKGDKAEVEQEDVDRNKCNGGGTKTLARLSNI